MLNLFLLFFCVVSTGFAQYLDEKRPPSAPFISGDDFRGLADFIYDETNQSLLPSDVEVGDIIFLAADAPFDKDLKIRDQFFREIHPCIKHPYILITHNSDKSSPGPYKKHLKDKNLCAWFAENPDIQNEPKLIPIPIGLENACWGRNYPRLIKTIQVSPKLKNKTRSLLYGNFSIETNRIERQFVFDMFKNRKFCWFSPIRKNLFFFLKDIYHTPFILSPHGNGLDCHRTWEALLLRSIPVVKTSSLDPLYADLPVLIVKKWEEVDELMLRAEYKKIMQKEYKWEKLYFEYWKNLILNTQKKCRIDWQKQVQNIE